MVFSVSFSCCLFCFCCFVCFGQDLLPAVSDEEMKAMEAEIARVQQQLSESEQSWSALNSGKCMCTAIRVGLCHFR